VLDLFTLGDLFKFGIELGSLRFLEFQFRKSTLVIDWDGCSVLHCPLDIVDADIVTKNSTGVLIGQFDRGACETDKRSIWQRLPHMPGKAVDEIVLAAMRFICDNDDVAAVR